MTELEELRAEVAKLRAEVRGRTVSPDKLTWEAFWRPLVIGACLVVTVATITGLVIKVLQA